MHIDDLKPQCILFVLLYVCSTGKELPGSVMHLTRPTGLTLQLFNWRISLMTDQSYPLLTSKIGISLEYRVAPQMSNSETCEQDTFIDHTTHRMRTYCPRQAQHSPPHPIAHKNMFWTQTLSFHSSSLTTGLLGSTVIWNYYYCYWNYYYC